MTDMSGLVIDLIKGKKSLCESFPSNLKLAWKRFSHHFSLERAGLSDSMVFFVGGNGEFETSEPTEFPEIALDTRFKLHTCTFVLYKRVVLEFKPGSSWYNALRIRMSTLRQLLWKISVVQQPINLTNRSPVHSFPVTSQTKVARRHRGRPCGIGRYKLCFALPERAALSLSPAGLDQYVICTVPPRQLGPHSRRVQQELCIALLERAALSRDSPFRTISN
jgi:hypothetical protein